MLIITKLLMPINYKNKQPSILTGKVVEGISVVVIVGGCSVSGCIPSPDPPSPGAASTRPPGKPSSPVQFLKTTVQNSSRKVSD